METTFLTSGKVTRLLEVSEKTLRRWEKNGILLPHHKSTSGYKYYTEQQLRDFSESYHENSKRNVETAVKEVHGDEIADNEMESNSQVEIERQSKAYVAPYHYFGTSRLVRELENISLNELVTVPMGRFGSVDVLMWVDKAMQKKIRTHIARYSGR